MTAKRGPVAGTEHARCGDQAVKAKYGPDCSARIGKQGGEVMPQHLGERHYGAAFRGSGVHPGAARGTPIAWEGVSLDASCP